MHQTRIHLKSWWFQNIQAHQSLWMMLVKKRSTTKTAFSQESTTHLQTAFMVYCFPSCPLWILSKLSLWHDRVCYADAGQTLFKTLLPYILCFCQSSVENGCWLKILLKALVNKVPNVFMHSKCSLGHHKVLQFSLFFNPWLCILCCHNNNCATKI